MVFGRDGEIEYIVGRPGTATCAEHAARGLIFPASEGAVLRLVTVPEGATPFTRMSGASSLASWRIMPNAACFEATYSTPPPT